MRSVPTSWESRRLKFLASVKPSSVDKKFSEGERQIRLCNYTDVYNNDVIHSGMDLMEASASADEVSRFKLRAGDVIVTKDSETWDDIAVPAYVSEDLPGVLCGYHLSLVRPELDLLDGKYLFYAFQAPIIGERLHIEAQGVTRFALNSDALASALFPVPQLSAQHAIAAFLDRKTAEIDALIAKKERLLELLEEKRTALITQAVTKGITPGVEMKESGVVELGSIPGHWQVLRLRHVLASVEQGWSPDCENREAGPEEWGVLKAGCVNRGLFVESEHKTLPAFLEPVPALEIQPGDLLMSRASGSRELVGSVARVQKVRSRLLLSDKIFRLRVLEQKALAQFLALALNARHARSQIELALSGGSGLANNIGQESVREIVLAVPPITEQLGIVEHVASASQQVDALAVRVQEAIALLREYRTALITAAVTGQIEVGT